MMILVFLGLLGLHSAAAVTHSLKAFGSLSVDVPNVPEVVFFMMVDDVQLVYYDSNTTRVVSTLDLVNRIIEEDPERFEKFQQVINLYQIEDMKQRIKRIIGVHIFQVILGCEWDDETEEVNGFLHMGYHGEDLISFDPKTETWIARRQGADLVIQELDKDKTVIPYGRVFHNHECPSMLKVFVNKMRSSLMRTVLPSVSLLQKTPSSPVSCFATGFYPDRAMMFWRKDGVKIIMDVELGEILPNHDGSFQMNADLYLSSVPPEDWRRYECVFRLSGVKDDIITKLDKTAILTNEGGFPVGAVVGVVVVLLLLVVCIVGYFLYRRKYNAGARPGAEEMGVFRQINVT